MIRIVDAPVIRDHRGWVINPVRDSGLTGSAPGSLHLVSLEPGAVRGNHAHPEALEWLVVMNGPAKVSWRNEPEGPLETIVTGESGPALLEIDAGCPHAVMNISSGTVYLLSFRDREDTETVRETLI